jgi:hypothetical protein
MSVACSPEAAFLVTDDGTDATAVGLQVNEFGLNRPACVGWFISEVEEALVDLHIIFSFDVGGFEFVHDLVV